VSGCNVVIFYFSRGGQTRLLADAIAEGVQATGAEALLRTVETDSDAASMRDLLLDKNELINCDALIMGSPTRFGHMSAHLQKFWETTSREWLNGDLIDKPAAVFTTTSSLHGGQESTLLNMALPLLHHGMLLTGIPYEQPSLHHDNAGGSPYGAGALNASSNLTLSANERASAVALGQRVATIAQQLKSTKDA
jgi:NAD(P)H dehydrogenase (quinone)|tara:strand:+ start:9853 stop:10434 length:582 start_codon:yes stop_codon:yes gene_type:complete